MESGTFVLHCTQVITEKGIKAMNTGGHAIMSSPGGGHTVVFGPDGRLMTKPLPEDKEGVIYADLIMDELVRNKMFVDSAGHFSRPDVLWLGISPEIPTVVRPQRVQVARDANEQIDW
jgi:nitrilase